MNVQAQPEILSDGGLPNTDPQDLEALAAAENGGHHGAILENILRCLFLAAVLSLIGVFAWRPGLLRFSVIKSFASPSRGESLAWKPEPETPAPLPQRKTVVPPGEWRLGSAYSTNWITARSFNLPGGGRGGRLPAMAWRRYSANPWQWQNDVGKRATRSDLDVQPAQKPASSFRAGDLAAWPEPVAVPNQAARQTPALEGLPPLPSSQNGGSLSFPSLTPAGAPAAASTPAAPALPASGASASGIFSELPALPAPIVVPGNAASLRPPELPAMPGVGNSAFAPPPRAAETATATAAPETKIDREPAAPAQPAEEPDWKNREITGPIPGAYLTIYPKLKFVGLCVPGQGYVRKYNQVAVPSDLSAPKESAQDGRTPYGKYYVAARNRDADGPRLFLSWPSPEDAERLGLRVEEKAEIARAWQAHALPPQDTAAGGGVGLDGMRNMLETTEGGFSLEIPHMEEIFTALPEGAWVFVQQQ